MHFPSIFIISIHLPFIVSFISFQLPLMFTIICRHIPLNFRYRQEHHMHPRKRQQRKIKKGMWPSLHPFFQECTWIKRRAISQGEFLGSNNSEHSSKMKLLSVSIVCTSTFAVRRKRKNDKQWPRSLIDCCQNMWNCSKPREKTKSWFIVWEVEPLQNIETRVTKKGPTTRDLDSAHLQLY